MKQRSVDVHQFAMVPRAEIPRSSFRIQTTYKTTFDAGYLIPVYCDEVLPGDSFRVNATMFARLSTPIVPIMDNLVLESFFFFVPNRLIWGRWRNMMGQRDNPDDTIDYTVPQVVSPTGGWGINTLYDYFGLPTIGQVGVGNTVSVNVLPLRCYNIIWNTWFRDQNLQNQATLSTGDGPDPETDYIIRRRGKRHDYFTGCLPWVQKGDPVPTPVGGFAPVFTGSITGQPTGVQAPLAFRDSNGNAIAAAAPVGLGPTGQLGRGAGAFTSAQGLYPSNLYADLSQAAGATVNQLRQSFQIQRLLERDARGGTRYTEQIRAHFGVISPDARQHRPTYLGGGFSNIHVTPIPQTSPGVETPLGFLGAMGTMAGTHSFSSGFTEHGYVLGLISVRADLAYQQGLRRMWSRKTRYDFYWPVFAMLGEQPVYNKEIYIQGNASDDAVFGYQERWAEYRYNPSLITGLFRSTATGTLDVWHLAQKYTSLPVLNGSFIQDVPPLGRILAQTGNAGKQLLLDCFFDINAARPMPLYSVPGLIDHL